MNLIIERKLLPNKLVFNIKGFSNLTCYANITLGLRCNALEVSEEGKEALALKQTNVFLKIVNSIPPFNIETFTPYWFFVGHKRFGKSKKLLFQPAFLFNISDNQYELREHSRNKFSLMKDSEQIGLIKRDPTKFQEIASYVIDCKNECSLALILLFCAFIDTQFYPNHASVQMYKREIDVVINDKYASRVNWTSSPNECN